MDGQAFEFTITGDHYIATSLVTELHRPQCRYNETNHRNSSPGFEDSVLLAFWPTPGDFLDEITEKKNTRYM